MIDSLSELIERVEAIKADIPQDARSLDQHGEVGWIRAPLERLLDQCREECEAMNDRKPRLVLAPLAKCGARWEP